jgi:hypothetical protein
VARGIIAFFLSVCFSFCPVKYLSLLVSLYIGRFSVLVFCQFWVSVLNCFVVLYTSLKSGLVNGLFCVCKTFVRINVLKMSPYSPKHPLRHNGPAMKRWELIPDFPSKCRVAKAVILF